ncbi:hypothetical protein EG829_17800, partial [bacterium]|nr:hypothetical protein [bacterium]
MNPSSIVPFITEGMSPLHVRLRSRLIDSLADEFMAWAATAGLSEPLTVEHAVHFLVASLSVQQARLGSLRTLRDDFNGRYNRSYDENEQREHILLFCRELGAGEQELEEDRKALDRWFGHDGLMDRFRKRFTETERRICFILDRLGAVAAKGVVEAGSGEARLLWGRIALEKV